MTYDVIRGDVLPGADETAYGTKSARHRRGYANYPASLPAAHGDSALSRWFADNEPSGGLVEPVHDMLRRSGETRVAVIDALSTYFEGSDLGPLLRDVGLYDDELAEDAAEAPAAAEPPSAVAAAAQYDRWCRIAERRERETRGRSRERLRVELLGVARERHAYWTKGEAF